jgi:tetratricopeptide (TPR) repeat protein
MKITWRPSVQSCPIIAGLCVAMIVAIVVSACRRAPQQDGQCSNPRRRAAVYPQDAKTADEALKRGDEAYDAGNCNQAIAAYTQAVALNPEYAEAYNNRAYTYMRMQEYAPALKDLDQALRIRPDYVHALMNRGDIHNYYFEQNRKNAIADYDHILRVGGKSREPSVCGHRAVAIYSLPGHEGWNALSWFKLVARAVSGQDVCAMKAT